MEKNNTNYNVAVLEEVDTNENEFWCAHSHVKNA